MHFGHTCCTGSIVLYFSNWFVDVLLASLSIYMHLLTLTLVHQSLFAQVVCVSVKLWRIFEIPGSLSIWRASVSKTSDKVLILSRLHNTEKNVQHRAATCKKGQSNHVEHMVSRFFVTFVQESALPHHREAQFARCTSWFLPLRNGGFSRLMLVRRQWTFLLAFGVFSCLFLDFEMPTWHSLSWWDWPKTVKSNGSSCMTPFHKSIVTGFYSSILCGQAIGKIIWNSLVAETFVADLRLMICHQPRSVGFTFAVNASKFYLTWQGLENLPTETTKQN